MINNRMIAFFAGAAALVGLAFYSGAKEDVPSTTDLTHTVYGISKEDQPFRRQDGEESAEEQVAHPAIIPGREGDNDGQYIWEDGHVPVFPDPRPAPGATLVKYVLEEPTEEVRFADVIDNSIGFSHKYISMAPRDLGTLKLNPQGLENMMINPINLS